MDVFQIIKSAIKKFLPKPLLDWNRNRKLEQLRAKNKILSTQEVFTTIYANNEWGGEAGTFCSGSGSREEVASPYCKLVKEFVAKHGVTSILDLGCGDFSVGQNLQTQGVSYVGVDIVQNLIDRNTEIFGSKSITFKCLNIIEDQLPAAELVLVRQVLQHLSNEQIAKVLNKLLSYPYVMITEHYPASGSEALPNIDKPHGGDTRLVDNSAVYLDRPPFNISKLQLMLDVKAPKWLMHEGETIKTWLITQPNLR